MGGDKGVSINIAGALMAVREDGASVILVGDETVLKAELERVGATALLSSGRLTIRHAPEAVEMDEKPSMAARRKKGSSMRVACELVKSGEACGALSSGNSGAMMAVALLVFGRIDGVLRPAIGSPTPSKVGGGILIDAGANIDCSPEHLFQFGVLGSTYVHHVHGIERPTCGVVANGEEDSKGTELTRDTLALLRQTDLNIHGHIEGRDVTLGTINVAITDGFTGNVLLKTGEGAIKMMLKELKDGFANGGPLVKLGGLLSKPMFNALRKRIDPNEFGAAPLLGLALPAFIAHGSSDPYMTRRAIAAVRKHAANDVTAHLKAAIAKTLPILEQARLERGPASPASAV
jgi:glycerol-3-phosphate acyltransferase PlsX